MISVIDLRYTPFERIPLRAPVDRVGYLVERCRGRAVLDLGCCDETALAKRGTDHWLHGAVAKVARTTFGIDRSVQVPPGGLSTGPTSRIVRGDVTDIERLIDGVEVELVLAGELIEHLSDAIGFLRQLRRLLPGRELLATTPNATSLTNVLVGLMSRESNHPDHVQIYSFKTLHTVCRRAGFGEWEILPYHVYYEELALRSGPVARRAVRAMESAVNACERLFPLLSGGWVLHVWRM